MMRNEAQGHWTDAASQCSFYFFILFMFHWLAQGSHQSQVK